MNTEIIESCYNELVNEINNVNKQIEVITLNIKMRQKEIDEARGVVNTLSHERNLLLDERARLNTRSNRLNGMVEMLKSYKEVDG